VLDFIHVAMEVIELNYVEGCPNTFVSIVYFTKHFDLFFFALFWGKLFYIVLSCISIYLSSIYNDNWEKIQLLEVQSSWRHNLRDLKM